VLAVVATETSRPVLVAVVHGVSFPVDIHVWKDRAVVNLGNGPDGGYYIRLAVLEDGWIVFFVKPLDRSSHTGVCIAAVLVGSYERVHCKLFYPRKVFGNDAAGQRLVYLLVRSPENVRWTVVAIHAIHGMAWNGF